MLEYTIVTAPALGRLEKDVTEHLSDGWQLQGGIAATAFEGREADGSGTFYIDYFQAMTREAEGEEVAERKRMLGKYIDMVEALGNAELEDAYRRSLINGTISTDLASVLFTEMVSRDLLPEEREE